MKRSITIKTVFLYCLLSLIIKPLLSQNKENVPMYYFHGVNDFGYMWNGYKPYFEKAFSTSPQQTLQATYTDKNATNGGDDINQIATKLKETINQYPNKSQAIAIAHSMGGLVAREAYRINPQGYSGLISIGTPHLGAEIARGIYDKNKVNEVLDRVLYPTYNKGVALASAVRDLYVEASKGIFLNLSLILPRISAGIGGLISGYSTNKANLSINDLNNDKDNVKKDFEDALEKNRHYNLFRGENMTPGNGFLNTLNNTPTAPPLISIYGIESSPIYLKTGSVRNYIAKYDDKTYPRPNELVYKDNDAQSMPVPCPYGSNVSYGCSIIPFPNLERSFYSYNLNNDIDKNRLESIKNYDINKIKETLEKADESIESDVVDFGGWWDWTGWTNVSGKRQRARDKLNEFRVWIGTGINNNTFGKEGGGLEQTMNAEIGAVHEETRTYSYYAFIGYYQQANYVCNEFGGAYYPVENLERTMSTSRRHSESICFWYYQYIPRYTLATYSTSYPVQEGSDGVVPNKMSVGSGKAGVNDGGKYPAPPNMIQAIPLLGVNHSEMGNNPQVRDAIKGVLSKGINPSDPNDIFRIKTK